MAIVDEPVRGSVPPPWFLALPGIDRIRALANGFVVRPPLFRLLGIRVGHVAPGSVTLTMPASAWLSNRAGLLDIHPFIEAALTAAATTGLAPAADLRPFTLNVEYLRPVRAQAGSLLARARLVHINASQSVVYAEVEVEDATGRGVAHAASQSLTGTPKSEPPPAPVPLSRVEEPDYPTPDPAMRPVPAFRFLRESDACADPLGVARRLLGNDLCAGQGEMLALNFREVDEGRVMMTMPASEWLASFSRNVSPGALALIGNASGSVAILTKLVPETTFAGIGFKAQFVRSVPADGRALRGEATVSFVSADRAAADVRVLDADDRVILKCGVAALVIPGRLREERRRADAKRVLATLLFTDVVDSTGHVDRLGDARWRDLLAEFRALVRAEVARCEGIEVDTAGDGFFVRFESPAAAIDCARAVRNTVGRLGISVRSGIHAGECEMKAGKPTGTAVHAAARIQAAASDAEILVSDTVKAVATGSGLRFEGRGTHELKGIPGAWLLHAVIG